METPAALDKLSDRQERRGAKIFFRALKTQYTELARQYEAGRELEPNRDIVKKALTGYYTKVQLEMAQWQYDELERYNPVKSFQMGTYERILNLIRTWVTLNSGEYIQSISATTLEQVKKVIAQGQTDGFGARKIGQLIRQEAKSPFTVYRSTVIARTEGTRAASQGAKFGAEQWEKISGQEKWKAWSVSIDGRERESHAAMKGKDPIPGSQDFIVGGKPMEGPGDPKGGKANVIQCRCRKYYMSERMARQMMAGSTPIPQAPVVLPPVDDDAKEREIILGNTAAYKIETARKKLLQKAPELDDVQAIAINTYSGSTYQQINNYLRERDKFDAMTSENQIKNAKYWNALANQVNKGLDKMPKYNGKVFRGTYRLDDNILGEYKRAFETGNPHTEKALMSTSLELQNTFGASTVFEVHSKTGVLIEELSDHAHEKEVLFKHGTKFKVTGYQKIGNSTHITMRELAQR